MAADSTAGDKTGWTLGATLARQAAARGGQPFLTMKDGETVTYAQAHAIANRMANGLIAAGVRQAGRVAVMLPNSLEYFHTWAGISRAGGVHVAINTAYKGGFLRHVLTNADAALMILHADYLPWLAEIEDEVPSLQTVYVLGSPAADAPPLRRIAVRPYAALLNAPDADPGVPVSHADVGVIMYTSGTTGPSKGVLMPHGHLYVFGEGCRENLRLTAEDVYYICMPLFHANALLMQLYGTLVAGARAFIAPVFSASGWLEDVRESGATVTNTLGVMTEFIWRQPPSPQDQAHRLRVIQAIPTAPDLAAPFMARFGVPVVEAYGMTEVNIVLFLPMDAPHRPGSCGLPYSRFYEVRVGDPETDEPLPAGQVGEILVRPREPFCFMTGYNAMPEKTVEAWRNLWFHTGDAGRVDADGYFYFVDRIKDCIRRRGENISSYEVEVVVAEHPAVAEVAAIAVPSEVPGGEDEIKVCIVPKPGETLDPAALMQHCIDRMPYFAVPRFVETLDALPKTPTAKVQKAKLRAAGHGTAVWDREAAGITVARPGAGRRA